MKRRIGQAILLISITAIIIICSVSYSFGTPIDDKRAEQQQISGQMSSINSQLQSVISSYDEAQTDLNRMEEAVAARTEQLNNCEAELTQANNIFNERAKGIYKYGQVNLLEVIFGSKSVGELTERFDLVNRIGMADAELIKQVKQSRVDIENVRNNLEQDHARQAALVAQIEQDKDQIESQLSEKRTLLSSIEGEISRFAIPVEEDPPLQSVVRGRPGPTHGGVVGIAEAMIGIPYVYGGASPDEGFDCSGLVSYCYAQIGISLNRTCDYPPNLSWDELQPGDLVYSHGGGHVGIYSGGGMQIHAPYSGTYVQEGPIYSFCGGYRP